MNKPGPKTKLTEEVRQRIIGALRTGNYRLTACAWAGVSYRAFAEWMQRGKEHPDTEHGEFRRAVMEAEKAAEIRAVGLVMRAAEHDPEHAEWWLTHRYPERWSEKRITQKHEHKHAFSELTDEQLEAKYRALMAKASPIPAPDEDKEGGSHE